MSDSSSSASSPVQRRWSLTSKGWFFGFKLHILATAEKKICQAVLTPGNYADRNVAESLTEFFDYQTVIGDLGYRGEKLQAKLFEENNCILITKQDVRQRKQHLLPIRQRIEAGFSILWHHLYRPDIFQIVDWIMEYHFVETLVLQSFPLIQLTTGVKNYSSCNNIKH